MKLSWRLVVLKVIRAPYCFLRLYLNFIFIFYFFTILIFLSPMPNSNRLFLITSQVHHHICLWGILFMSLVRDLNPRLDFSSSLQVRYNRPAMRTRHFYFKERILELKTGFEPVTSSLPRKCTPTVLHQLLFLGYRRDSNSHYSVSQTDSEAPIRIPIPMLFF